MFLIFMQHRDASLVWLRNDRLQCLGGRICLGPPQFLEFLRSLSFKSLKLVYILSAKPIDSGKAPLDLPLASLMANWLSSSLHKPSSLCSHLDLFLFYHTCSPAPFHSDLHSCTGPGTWGMTLYSFPTCLPDSRA